MAGAPVTRPTGTVSAGRPEFPAGIAAVLVPIPPGAPAAAGPGASAIPWGGPAVAIP